jgi:TolA-binding protein
MPLRPHLLLLCLLLWLGAAVPPGAVAQRLAADEGPLVGSLHQAHLYGHGRWAASIGTHLWQRDGALLPTVAAEETEFNDGVAATQLFNADAEQRLMEFVTLHPEHPRVPMARFHLGTIAFRRKRYNAVIEHFALAQPKDLSAAQLEEYYFKRGYALMQGEKYSEAKDALSHITEAGTKYRSAAVYYMAHMQYAEGSHEAALKGFRSLEDDELFGPVVPYYILQIEFLQERYAEVVPYGKELLKKGGRRAPEVNRLVGESLYRMGQFAECIPFIEAGLDPTVDDRHAHYQLGYAAYRTGDCRKAAENYELVTTMDDTLSQVAYYQMADCMLRQGEKVGAQSAFRMAARNSFDPAIQEDALFNFAKLAYELSYDPYHEAIRAFEEYLKKHPDSPRADEAWSFLLKVYLATHSYEAALGAIERMRSRGPEMQLTYQRTAYLRGIELFGDGLLEASAQFLSRSQKLPIDARLEARAEFWQAEILHRQGDRTAAAQRYASFLRKDGAPGTEEYALGHYNLAYVHFEQKQYTEAIAWFRRFEPLAATDALRLSDAYLRIADAYYIGRDMARAIEWYDKAIRLNRSEVDYAMFQVAVCYGLQGSTQSKIESLKVLLEEHPGSSYAPDANYEIAEAYLNKGNPTEAEKWFDRLIMSYPNSLYMAKAKLNKGLIAYNANQDQKAIALFKEVAEGYPATSEAKEALIKLNKIYVEDGNVAAYEAYLKEKKFPELTTAALDSSYFESAELLYMKGSHVSAYGELKKYVERYPNGIFRLNAHFYLAESAMQVGKPDEALAAYDVVLGYARNIFTEKSLYTASRLLMERKRYEEALLRLAKLEEVAEVVDNLVAARVNIMRIHVLLKRCDPAMTYARLLIDSDKIEQELLQEATLVHGRCALEKGHLDLARTRMNEVIALSAGAEAAEAQFYLADIAFRSDSIALSEAHVLDLVNSYSAHPKWVSRGFLLLSDINLKKGDAFQSKLILQNIVANFEGEQAVEAQRRLDEMAAQEAERARKEAEAVPVVEPAVEFTNPVQVNPNIFEEEVPVEQPRP